MLQHANLTFFYYQSHLFNRFRSLQHSNLHWNLSSVNNNPGRGIRSGTRSPCGIARRRFGLAKLQAKLCRSTMEAMPHVQKAATVAAETCQTVFQDRRWNCSSIVTAPYLTPDLTRGKAAAVSILISRKIKGTTLLIKLQCYGLFLCVQSGHVCPYFAKASLP